jgi:pilus assembly protein Flp/PilA
MALIVHRLLAAAASRIEARGEEGQTFVEYALILAFIAILMILALTFLRNKIASLYSHVANSL